MTYTKESIPTLTVYKASAGSGKTFTLAVEYIKLLITNPFAYENILAVTFTNKATEEMKHRILSQLYGLWKQLPSSSDYMGVLKEDTGMSEKQISANAGKALKNLLHNYHFFRVQTIDTFFQGVLRNLARELQLNANLKVGLNVNQVIDEAIDELIDSLSEDKELMRIILSYMQDKLNENKTWNVTGNLKDFGGNIFSEKYKRSRKKMDEAFRNPTFFDDYKKELQELTRNFEESFIEQGKAMLKAVEDNGFVIDDFVRKSSGPIGYVLKLSKGGLYKTDTLFNQSIQKALEDSSAWSAKSSKKRDEIIAFAESYLNPAIARIEESRKSEARRAKSARETLKHINDVRLLRKIEDTTKELNDNVQRFMLSDTQALLNELIDQSDSSFIFEKIGAYLKHIMIDEFQDTSVIQWENFKTILQECMSHGDRSLLVGDVKQSIYRFRNGDWRLLNNIESHFSHEQLEFNPRLTNYRSDRNVINFNNLFFKIASELEVQSLMPYSEEKALQLRKAYSDVEQQIPEKREVSGFVHIDLLPADCMEEMEERVLDIINGLLSRGAKQKDIAILLRNNKDIAKVAEYIEKNSDVNIISNEAFQLGASPAVRTIVNAMKSLLKPEDTLTTSLLQKEYGGELPEEFLNSRQRLLTLTLHELTEELIRILSIDKENNESAYITTFFDQLSTFCEDIAPVLEDFIEAWDDHIYTAKIETPEINGVRILTMHKSKGLEFKHVIIPYCNWSVNPSKKVILWAEPSEEPFSKLPVVPLDYYSVNSFKDTIYEDYGTEEHIQEVVDNLNLLYVAMTRAGSSLFIIGERTTKAVKRSKLICDVMDVMPEEIEGVPVMIQGKEDEDDVLELIYGKLQIKDKKRTEEAGNVFVPEVKPVSQSVVSYQSTAQYRQSNSSRSFADDLYDESDRQRYIRIGTVMHQLFSTIRTIDDVEPTLRQMEFGGLLYEDDESKEKLIASIRQQFNKPEVQYWFSDKWTLYNECTILTPEGEQRPDRVMTDGKETIVVDFKFGKPKEEYKHQLERYMELLRRMNMPNVSGHLWYIQA